MNILTIIQARVGSTRLRNKVLMPLSSKPLLFHLFERVVSAKFVGKVVIATTQEAGDDLITDLCRENKIECFRGHPNDLLDRHYKAALKYSPQAVVKIPSDCPLIDPGVIDKVLKYYIDNHNKFDFVSNLHPPSYPDGNDIEIMSMSVLKDAWINAKKDFEREHTTPYIWERPDKFRIGNVLWESGLNYSMSYRFTIDYEEDYQFIKKIYDELYIYGEIFSLDQILNLLERKPEIRKINEKYIGVNWYRHHLNELKTISEKDTRII